MLFHGYAFRASVDVCARGSQFSDGAWFGDRGHGWTSGSATFGRAPVCAYVSGGAIVAYVRPATFSRADPCTNPMCVHVRTPLRVPGHSPPAPTAGTQPGFTSPLVAKPSSPPHLPSPSEPLAINSPESASLPSQGARARLTQNKALLLTASACPEQVVTLAE